jgi:hypothetical protein
MTLYELVATVMAVLGCTMREARKRIREALAAGWFHLKWTNPPTAWGSGSQPPGRDPRWLMTKIKWRKGLVLADFELWPGGNDEGVWRGLLVFRASVAQWVQTVTAVPVEPPPQLALVKQHEEAPSDSPPSLLEASEKQVRQAIGEIYDHVECGRKPPNKRELVKPVQEKLRAAGAQKSGRQIMVIADDPRYKSRRWRRGQTRAKNHQPDGA